jgi:hypothetical protein
MKKIIVIILTCCLSTFFDSTLIAQQTNVSTRKAMIAGVSGGDIIKDTIMKYGVIRCSDTSFIVTSYKLSINVLF